MNREHRVAAKISNSIFVFYQTPDDFIKRICFTMYGPCCCHQIVWGQNGIYFCLHFRWVCCISHNYHQVKETNQQQLNTLRSRQNGRKFPDNIFKCIFFNENVWISIKISLKCVPRHPVDRMPALVLIMALHRTDDKPLSEPMMVYVAAAYMHHSDSMS